VEPGARRDWARARRRRGNADLRHERVRVAQAPAERRAPLVRTPAAGGDVRPAAEAERGRPGAQRLFGDHLVSSRSYVALVPGTNVDVFAARLQSRFIGNGAEAFSISALMNEAFSTTHQIFQLFEGYLAMGLLVGIAGIAVIMIRAVRERRRQIGTLRALGFPARSMGRSFAIEAAYVAVQGTLVGVLLSLLTLYTIIARSDAMGDLAFGVPYLELSLLLAGTVLASLAATVVPALRASKIRPAVALRVTD
jgi:putative ABC transport system permease protein